MQGDHLYGIPLTAVSKMSGILLKVREVSGKKSCQGKLAEKTEAGRTEVAGTRAR